MHLFVGSDNPVKVNAVVMAASETWPEAVAKGYKVASGVDDQPRSDEETKTGAINRARAALEQGSKEFIDENEILGVGMEGGVFLQGEELWSTVWAAVVDRDGNLFTSNGARTQVPEPIATLVKNGEEMGPVVVKLTGNSDVRQGIGMIGVITSEFIDRTEEYSGIVKFALGLWYGRDWTKKL